MKDFRRVAYGGVMKVVRGCHEGVMKVAQGL